MNKNIAALEENDTYTLMVEMAKGSKLEQKLEEINRKLDLIIGDK